MTEAGDNTRIDGFPIRLRPVKSADRDQLFAWRNDPWLISFSTSGKTVEKQDHADWFGSVLNESDCVLYIILTERDTPSGAIRFDRLNDSSAMTSVFLSREYTGKGYGELALRDGCQMVFQEWQIKEISGVIKNQNTASISAFLKAGFSSMPADSSTPPEHSLFVLNRTFGHRFD
jgi:RimJ/RimL family protein N-acetyltransferase